MAKVGNVVLRRVFACTQGVLPHYWGIYVIVLGGMRRFDPRQCDTNLTQVCRLGATIFCNTRVGGRICNAMGTSVGNSKISDVNAPTPKDVTQELVRSFIQAENEHVPEMAPPANRAVRGHAPKAPPVRQDDPNIDMSLVERMRAYRPTRTHVAWAAFAIVMLWKPWLIPVLVILSMWIGLVIYLTVGHDRVAEFIDPLWARFAARFPNASASILHRVQIGADQIEGWLARMPEGWCDEIYLPDFGRSHITSLPETALDKDANKAANKTSEKMQSDPFERLAALASLRE